MPTIRPIHELTVEELRDCIDHEQRKINNIEARYPVGVTSEWIEDEITFATIWRDNYRAELKRRTLSTGDSK